MAARAVPKMAPWAVAGMASRVTPKIVPRAVAGMTPGIVWRMAPRALPRGTPREPPPRQRRGTLSSSVPILRSKPGNEAGSPTLRGRIPR
jgi:hypothetical protein